LRSQDLRAARGRRTGCRPSPGLQTLRSTGRKQAHGVDAMSGPADRLLSIRG
jgi:hypothetical protein